MKKFITLTVGRLGFTLSILSILCPGILSAPATEPVLTVSGSGAGFTLPDGIARLKKPEALSFSGTPLRLDDDRPLDWLPKTAITVEVWVRVVQPTAWTGFAGCLQDNGTYERGWVLGCQEGSFYFGLAAEKPMRLTYLSASTPLAAGAWYQVAGTYDGSRQRIYIDGELAGESLTQSGPITYASRLIPVVGAYRDDNDLIPLKGDLESLNIWNRALAAEEIATRFEARKHLFPGIERDAADGTDELNWPTFRHDNQRSGHYPRDLTLPLKSVWIHRPQHPPKAAWPGTAQSDFWRNRAHPEKPRVEFDKAYHVVASNGRVLYGTSADDQVVCLDLQTGKPLWTFFAEAPVRLAPTISDERVVFGSDDGFVYCLKLADGELIWRQSAVAEPGKRRPGNGRMIGKFPVRSGVVVRDGTVYYAAGLFPNQGVWYGSLDLKDGRPLDGKSLDVSPQGYLREQNGRLHTPTGRHPSGANLQSLKNRSKFPAKKSGKPTANVSYEWITTPSTRVTGGDGSVAVFDGDSGETIWEASVEGRVLGLAIAEDTLLASTDKGVTYAFRSAGGQQTVETGWPTGQPVRDASAASRAAEILNQCGRNRGYALVVGDEAGQLTLELGRQSEFQVIGIDLSPEAIQRQRLALARAGLYGRVVIHDVSLETSPYLNRLFNLVVLSPATRKEASPLALLRPGGLLVQGETIERAPALPGAGNWSHLYGNPGNTACSLDTVSTEHLELQWFGEPGPQKIIDRHLRAMAPVARDGYLFVPGNDWLYGVDGFNGTILWEKSIEAFRRIGVLRGSGSLAVGDQFLYAAAGGHCLILDRTTGEEKGRIPVPAGPDDREWGYLAVLDDTVVGSAVREGGVYRTFSRAAIYGAGYGDNTKITVSKELFAHNVHSGSLQWRYQPKGVVFEPAIAMNKARVVFLESRDAATLKGPARSHYPALLHKEGGDLVALDRLSGEVTWRHAFDSPQGIQTLFLLCTDKEVIVAFSLNTVAEGAKAPTVHYETRVYEADGTLRWRQRFNTGKRPNLDHGEQDRHPAVVGTRLIVEPHIYDLTSGELLDTFKRGYGCGTVSASANDLFFRSGHPASYRLETKKITPLNKVSRPGCWINIITSDGLVLVPEASSGCICKFSLQCSMAFAPSEAP